MHQAIFRPSAVFPSDKSPGRAGKRQSAALQAMMASAQRLMLSDGNDPTQPGNKHGFEKNGESMSFPLRRLEKYD